MMGGPRIVVRSIKPINKGERVTIAYTDLLQPKDLRQSELWSKYRFTCSCPRCLALPLTYVDQRLLVSITCFDSFVTTDRYYICLMYVCIIFFFIGNARLQ